jgi:hypothetical protein
MGASIGVSHFPINGSGVAITHGSKRELSLYLVKDYDRVRIGYK